MTDLFLAQLGVTDEATTPITGDALAARPLALYVHWPWCLKKCPYCDFNSHVLADHPADDYTQALCGEIAAWAQRTGPRWLVSIFFGGGTPSLMGAARIGQVIAAAAKHYTLSDDVEITVECNPTSSPAELFAGLRTAGVNRVSVGVQGLNGEALRFLGREHDVAQAQASLDGALTHIGNVNADLIYGLPQQDLNQWQTQLHAMARLGLRHISAYQLTIEPNTHFFSQVRRGLWQPLDDDRQADFTEATRTILAGHGYENYEISNFSLAGQACRHNVHVWEYGDYLGIGAGAHGRVRLADGRHVATSVRKDPLAYLEARKSGGNAAFSLWHEIPAEEALQEAFIMGLRLKDGLNLTTLCQTTPLTSWQAALNTQEGLALLQEGWLETASGRLKASETAWLHTNRLLRDLLRAR